MPDYGDMALSFPHELIIGDDYRPLVYGRLKDPTGAFYSLSGASGVAKVKTEFGGEVLATPTVTFAQDATSWYFYWALADDVTALLKPQEAYLSVRITFSDGTKKTVVRTQIAIVPDGTV